MLQDQYNPHPVAMLGPEHPTIEAVLNRQHRAKASVDGVIQGFGFGLLGVGGSDAVLKRL